MGTPGGKAEPSVPEPNAEGPEKRVEEKNALKPFHGSHWRSEAPSGAASPQAGQVPSLSGHPAAGREGAAAPVPSALRTTALPAPQGAAADPPRPGESRRAPPACSPAGRGHSEPPAAPARAARSVGNCGAEPLSPNMAAAPSGPGHHFVLGGPRWFSDALLEAGDKDPLTCVGKGLDHFPYCIWPVRWRILER